MLCEWITRNLCILLQNHLAYTQMKRNMMNYYKVLSLFYEDVFSVQDEGECQAPTQPLTGRISEVTAWVVVRESQCVSKEEGA